MEKIININMAGRVIAIEDQAYTQLKSYLESLHSYFAAEEGRDEIMNDIESRVAELMDNKIKKGSVAINTMDIDEIIGSIGRVEDFAAADDEPSMAQTTSSNNNSNTGQKSRKFYRDANDKIAGGVCSGIAAYLNLDPTLVRIVFAILGLGGLGGGLLLYIALWIFVPVAPLAAYHGHRLYRNAEDKWLGGVCSGLAAYFDKEVWMFRLGFAAPFLLSMVSGRHLLFLGTSFIFGSLTGTFILIYIVLWIVLPLANTDFRRMEMRGEKVDLNSIRKNVMADIKDRSKVFKGEVTDSAQRLKGEAQGFLNTRGKDFAQEARASVKPLATQSATIISTLFKTLFFCLGILIAFSLFMVLIGYSFGGFGQIFNDFILQTPGQRSLAWATVFLFFGIPLLGLITFMVRRAMKMRSSGRFFSMGYSLLWAAGWICLIILASKVSMDFRHREVIRQEIPLIQPANGCLIVTVPGSEIIYSNSLPWLSGEIHGWDINKDFMQSARVMVVPILSPDSQYHVIVKRSALGANRTEANARAEHIAYSVRKSTDSLLTLDNGYTISKKDGYRAQEVIVEIQIPIGKKIKFDESVDDKLSPFHIRRIQATRHRSNHWVVGWSDDESSNDWSFENDRNEWEPNIEYTMNAKGMLVNPSGNEILETTEGEETDSNSSRRINKKMDSLDRSLEEIERQKEQLDNEQ